MTIYPLDIAAEQVVRWLAREQSPGLSVRASRMYLTGGALRPLDGNVSDQDREDLTQVTSVGQLEVSPRLSHEDWVLRVRIEDSLGARLPEDEPASLAEEEIDLSTFTEQFVLPARGTTFVNVEAQSEEAYARFEPLLNDLATNRHAG